MAKKLRANNVKLDLKIIDSKILHGFLQLHNSEINSHEAFNLVLSSLKQIIENFENENI